MRNILIKDWSEKDFSAVRKILLETWLNTYTFIPEEDIRFHLEKFYTIEKFQQLYSDSNTNGFMAEVNENPIGWMKSYNNEDKKRFYVSSLYVLPDYQGFGIGRKFLEVAESLASKMNYDRIWLGVMKDNIKALYWYNKIGFYFIE